MATSNINFEDTNADRNVQIWKIKKLIKSLESARGFVRHFMFFLNFCLLVLICLIISSFAQKRNEHDFANYPAQRSNPAHFQNVG